MKKIIIPIYIALLLFCSCEQEQDLVNTGATAATFLPAMGSPAPTRGEAATGPGASPATRVQDNLWSGNEIVGVAAFYVSSGEQATTKYHKYTPNKGMTGTHVQLVPATGETDIFYPVTGAAVNFTAFAPYPADANATLPEKSDTATYYLSKQTTGTNIMEKLDFIHHKGTTAYTQEAPVATLNFEHKLSRVVINLTRGANYTTSIAGSTATLTGVYTSVACNIANGGITPKGSGSIVPALVQPTGANAATTQVFQAIVAPQTSTSTPKATSRTLTLNIGGTNYTAEMPQDWSSGCSYTYNYVFDATGLTLAGSTVVNWGSGTIAWNGEYYLTLSESEVTLYKEASIGQTLSIKTNHTGDVTATLSDNANPTASVGSNYTWLTVNSLTGNSTNGWILTYSATENDSGAARTAYIHIKVGTVVTATVKVVQRAGSAPVIYLDGEANCFIVPPGRTIKFSVSRPVTAGTSTKGTAFTANILWQDENPGPVASFTTSGNICDLISVTASAVEGNAVLAIYVGSTIVWSYHIWVTDDPTATTYTHTNANGTFVFMDRNLGATRGAQHVTDYLNGTTITDAQILETYGVHYQWGRKDPFPGSAATTGTDDKIIYGPTGAETTIDKTGIGSTPVSMAASIQAPLAFYWMTSGYEWCSDDVGIYSTRWNSAANTKTLYDPCPAGWRVPVLPAFSTFSASTLAPWTTMGYNSSSLGWWPVAGLRRGGDAGKLADVGSGGYYWSGTPYPVYACDAQYLVFSSSIVNPSSGSSRVYGMALRCVAEN